MKKEGKKQRTTTRKERRSPSSENRERSSRADERFLKKAPPRLIWFDMRARTHYCTGRTVNYPRKPCQWWLACHHASSVDPSLPHLSRPHIPTCTPVWELPAPEISFFIQSWRFIYCNITTSNTSDRPTDTSADPPTRTAHRLVWLGTCICAFPLFLFPLFALRPQRGVVDTI